MNLSPRQFLNPGLGARIRAIVEDSGLPASALEFEITETTLMSNLPETLEALEELCRRDGEVSSLLRAVAPTWLLPLPWLSTTEEREALRRDLAGVSPDRMPREMGQFLDRYTERRPLLLVTEDLHWSDPATIQLIDYVARRRGGARLMWLASFRLTEVVALEHPFNRLRRCY